MCTRSCTTHVVHTIIHKGKIQCACALPGYTTLKIIYLLPRIKYVVFFLFTHVGASVTFGLCFVLPVLYCQFCIARNCTQLFFFILFFLSSPFSFYAAHTGQDEDILEDLSMFRNSCVVLMIDPLLPFDKDC